MLWSSTIRLFLESYLELFLTASLNIKAMNLQTDFGVVIASESLSRITFVMCCVIPPALLLILCKNRENLKSEAFQAKYGSFLVGTKCEQGHYEGAAGIWVVAFFVRRTLLGASFVYWSSFLWG